jgi:hypothetical protein
MKRFTKIAAWSALGVIALVVAFVLASANRPVDLPTPPGMVTTFTAAGPLPSGPPDLGRRVFLDVNAAAPALVFNRLARTVPCSLRLDPRVQRPVTLRVANVTARTALSAICESIGCRWELRHDTLIVDPVEPPPPIPQGELTQQTLRTPLPDMVFRRTPFSDAVTAIARQSGIEITVDNVDPRTPVSVDVTGDAPLLALAKVIRAAGWYCTGGSVDWPGDRPRIRLRPDRKVESSS